MSMLFDSITHLIGAVQLPPSCCLMSEKIPDQKMLYKILYKKKAYLKLARSLLGPLGEEKKQRSVRYCKMKFPNIPVKKHW